MISTTSNSIQYQGNGNSTVFPFPYLFEKVSDIVCTVLDSAVEGPQVLTLGVDYLVVINVNGGTVTLVVPPSTTETLLIQRILPLTQESEYNPNAGVPSDQLDSDLDRLVMIAQQLMAQLSLGLRVSVFDTLASLILPLATQRANMLLGFDVNGSPIPVIPANAGSVDQYDGPQFLTCSGPANSYSVTSPTGTSPNAGQRFSVKIPVTNTGSSTFTVNGTPTLSGYIKYAGTNLLGGMLVAGQVYEILYDGSNFTVLSPTSLGMSSVPNSALAPMPANTIKGNFNGSSALPQDLTTTQVGTMLAAAGALVSPLVGTVRNLVGSGAGGTKTAVWTCEELIAKVALAGLAFKGASLSLSYNGATNGAGGMDVGSSPVSGSLYLYAIYNPTTSTWATLGSISSGNVYSGFNMPSGYTASCLIWSGVTDSSGNFQKFNQQDRSIFFPRVNVLTAGSGSTSYTTFSLATIVPANGKTALGFFGSNANVANFDLVVASDSSGTAEVIITGGSYGPVESYYAGVVASFPILTIQILYYKSPAASSVKGDITGYTF